MPQSLASSFPFCTSSNISLLIAGGCILFLIQRLAQLLFRLSKTRDIELRSDSKLDHDNTTGIPSKPPRRNTITTASSLPPHQVRQLKHYKSLYHDLQNLEYHPDLLTTNAARSTLLSLLSSTLSEAFQSTSPATTILGLPTFSRSGLAAFLKAQHDTTTAQFAAYISRRRSGAPREMFKDREEAIWWLRQAAPVKYVDGSWLGHVNKSAWTPFHLRRASKDAWQVMSEELGDGDLSKNHVFVYEKLMDSLAPGLPRGDTKAFIEDSQGLDQVRVWRAAVAQLLVSLFAGNGEFLGEALGFNMAYEGLPLHLLKTIEELRELKLDGYYFVLHVSIDNADSGHARMAMEAVCEYIEAVRAEDGEEAAARAWKSVQAGFVLAEGLPTTPESPSSRKSVEEVFPWNERESKVVELFKAKAPVAHQLHCSSKLKIGRRSLVEWLDPNSFSDKQWQMDFLDDLTECRPWIKKGDSSWSKLVQELSWGGRMFGSFTDREMVDLKTWIDGLPDERPDVYCNFVGRSVEEVLNVKHDDIRTAYPVLVSVPDKLESLFSDQSSSNNFDHASGNRRDSGFHDVVSSEPRDTLSTRSRPGFSSSVSKIDLKRLLPLYFASISLLESFVTIPAKVSNPLGSALVRLLRAQSGFAAEGDGVAGMDEVARSRSEPGEPDAVVGLLEVGLELWKRWVREQKADQEDKRECDRASADKIRCTADILSALSRAGACREVQLAEGMLNLSMRPIEQRELLLGMTEAWVEFHEALAGQGNEELEMIAEDAEKDGTMLSERMQEALSGIAKRERIALDSCKEIVWTEAGEGKEKWARGRGLMDEMISSCSK